MEWGQSPANVVRRRISGEDGLAGEELTGAHGQTSTRGRQQVGSYAGSGGGAPATARGGGGGGGVMGRGGGVSAGSARGLFALCARSLRLKTSIFHHLYVFCLVALGKRQDVDSPSVLADAECDSLVGFISNCYFLLLWKSRIIICEACIRPCIFSPLANQIFLAVANLQITLNAPCRCDGCVLRITLSISHCEEIKAAKTPRE
jgi:hypothetical protein